MTTDNIKDINVAPRQVTGKHGKHNYVIEFDPSRRVWEWRAIVSVDYRLSGTHKSIELAEAAAKKAITKFVKANDGVL